MRKTAEGLNKGKKVAILVGAGALGATDELIAVDDKLEAGAAKALLGKAVLPDDLPWVTGAIGVLGTEPSRKRRRRSYPKQRNDAIAAAMPPALDVDQGDTRDHVLSAKVVRDPDFERGMARAGQQVTAAEHAILKAEHRMWMKAGQLLRFDIGQRLERRHGSEINWYPDI